jgi:hypothetical protein
MTIPKNLIQGKRKGGTQFPQISLNRAVEYARKLVSKTHTGPQPDTIILKGVFNNAHSDGKIRASALKQYKLLSGVTSAYDATDLAKRINSAPAEELQPFLQEACLNPKLFKSLYATFQGDTVTRAKIRQQALQLEVHPESGDKAVGIFVDSIVYAGLATEANGEITISRQVTAAIVTEAESEIDESKHADLPAPSDQVTPPSDGIAASDLAKPAETKQTDSRAASEPPLQIHGVGRGQMNVNLTVDSTMDPEKLDKSLALLRRYGVI